MNLNDKINKTGLSSGSKAASITEICEQLSYIQEHYIILIFIFLNYILYIVEFPSAQDRISISSNKLL